MPAISVIIPIYNAADFIRATIQTVMDQTWKDTEIIVIDDGSNDRSGEVINEYRDSVRYIRQENRGVASARNRGIKESTGRYLAFLDHDDLWHPTKLEKQVRVLESDPHLAIVLTDVGHIDRAGHPLQTIVHGYNPADDFARLFVRGYVPTPSSVLVRKSVLEKVGVFDERYNSAGLDDHELWARVAEEHDLASINEPLTLHRVGDQKPADIAIGHRPLLIATLLERFGNDGEKRRYLLREQALYLCDRGKLLIKQGQYRQGRECLLRGLVYSLGRAQSPKAAWRCFLRMIRSYL
ncbi:glycosyltransferase family 2 protein [Candidatus Nitrospira bockiana]